MSKRLGIVFGMVLLTMAGIIVGLIWFANTRDPVYQGKPLTFHSKLWAGCSINLTMIDTAKQQWAHENQKSEEAEPPTWDELKEYIGRGPNNAIVPKCPCGGTYTIGKLHQAAKCSLGPEAHTHERKEAYDAAKAAK
jgi:hypothetical protein